MRKLNTKSLIFLTNGTFLSESTGHILTDKVIINIGGDKFYVYFDTIVTEPARLH